MTRFWLRRMLASILGLVFAASMSVSTVQAADMAAKMAMTAAMGVVTSDAKCPECDHSGKNAKGMDCRLAVCTTPGIATLASALDVAIEHYELDPPASAQPPLVSWAHAPDPYPPRR
jgi:hypothetical protein